MNRVIGKLLVIAAWLSLSAIAFVTLVPLGTRPHVADVHFEHLGAFAVVGFLFGLAYPRHMLIAAAIVIGAAVVLEILQLFTPDRHARILDVLEKMLGAGIGLASSKVLLRLAEHSGWLNKK